MLKSWLNKFAFPVATPVQALAELYAYRIVVFFIFTLGLVVTLFWSITVIPTEWLGLWLVGLAILFAGVGFLGLRQILQGYRCTKIYPRWQLTILPPGQTSDILSKKPPFIPIWLGLLLLFGGALSFSLLINSFQVQWLIWDATAYHGNAVYIVGEGYKPDFMRPSGYAVLLSYFYRLFGSDYYSALFFFQNVINSLNSVIVFALGMLVTGKRSVAWVGGILCALCPFTAGYASALLTETLAIFLFTATIFLTVLVIKRPNIYLYYALLGLSNMLLLQVRYNFQLYIIVPILLVLLFSKTRLKLKLLSLGLLVAMSGAILFPAVLSNYKAYHQVVLFTKASNFTNSIVLSTYFNRGHWFREFVGLERMPYFNEKYPKALSYFSQCEVVDCPDLAEAKRQNDAYLAEYFEKYKWEYAGRVVVHLWDVWQQNYLFPYSFPMPNYFNYSFFTINLNRIYLFLMLIGLWFLARYRQVSLPIYGGIIYLWLIQAIFWVEPRYMLPIYPTILFVAALGLVSVVEGFRASRTKLSESSVRTVKPKKKKAWIVVPVISLAVVVSLSSLVNSESYQYAYGMQLQVLPDLLWFSYTPYYMNAMPYLLEDVLKMRAMPEAKTSSYAEQLDMHLARIYLRVKKYDEAVAAASRAITADPKNYEALHWRSVALEALGRMEEAAKDNQEFRLLLPKERENLANLKF